MMMFLWSLIAFIVAVSIIIIVHEFGHFIVARLCGVKVLRFSLGFGKPLFKFTSKKETEYVLAAIPLGGYVKMLDEQEAEVPAKDLPYAFNRKPLWARFAIVAAGPVFNFLFAIFAFWLMFLIGVTAVVPKIGEIKPQSIAAKANVPENSVIKAVSGTKITSWDEARIKLLGHLGKEKLILTVEKNNQTSEHILNIKDWRLENKDNKLMQALGITPYLPQVPPIIGKILQHSPAAKANLTVGDKITLINQTKINDWNQLREEIQNLKGKDFTLEGLRANQVFHAHITPEIKLVNGKPEIFIGVISQPVNYPKELMTIKRYNPLAAFVESLHSTWEIFKFTFLMLYKMAVGTISLNQIAGPIGIAQGAGITASLGTAYFLNFLALISVSVGILNILPIPILDGGHILYYIIEAVRRKPLSLQAQQFGMKIGLLLLLGLTILAFYNDLSRILS